MSCENFSTWFLGKFQVWSELILFSSLFLIYLCNNSEFLQNSTTRESGRSAWNLQWTCLNVLHKVTFTAGRTQEKNRCSRIHKGMSRKKKTNLLTEHTSIALRNCCKFKLVGKGIRKYKGTYTYLTTLCVRYLDSQRKNLRVPSAPSFCAPKWGTREHTAKHTGKEKRLREENTYGIWYVCPCPSRIFLSRKINQDQGTQGRSIRFQV